MKSNNTFALILAGCGHLDGAEITEATALNIALTQAGYKVQFYAPDRLQQDTLNHISGEPMEPNRNILVEAARIARGQILPITELDPQNVEGIAMAGGFGVIKNFTNFLEKGTDASLTKDIEIPLLAALTQKTPIIAICAAPMALALALKAKGIKDASLSFGKASNAGDFLPALSAWNITHIETALDEAHIDQKNHLITSGAYMEGNATPYEIFLGATACVAALKKL